MLRQLIRNFQRTLALQSVVNPSSHTSNGWCLLQRQQQVRTVVHVEKSKDETNRDFGIIENDPEYIIPYRNEFEIRKSNKKIIEALQTRYNFSTDDIDRIMTDDVLRICKQYSLLSTIEILHKSGVNKRSILNNATIITLEKQQLLQKLALIKSLELDDINHFVPFLNLTLSRLRKLVASLNRESKSIPFGNRVYYISDQLQMEPHVVTKYLAKRLFVLEMPFEILEQNLKHMINYNISSESILKDLWAFRYTPKSVQLRLERAKCAKKEKIMPWMVRCPETILQRSLKLSLDELRVLDGKSSVTEYIAERLGFTVDETKAILLKHPAVNTVRVTKIKEILDYLLDEAGYTRFEIAQVPRILCHSLKTTKERLNELKAMNCRPTTLVIVCRSKREYAKFITTWLNTQRKGRHLLVDDSTNVGGESSNDHKESQQQKEA